MSCKCGYENRAGAAFCASCGERLPVRCPSCAAELPARAAFCDGCGARAPDAVALSLANVAHSPADYTPKHLAEKILTSRAALEGERKQVTVLFADVKGSMELCEQVDVEEWHKILDHFFKILTDGVHRFEGTVNQYTGDGIMALFGAPIAHEDHAQRACYAALHLRDAVRGYADELRLQRGLNFSIRMGLNSGEVVVGKIGDDLRMDYTAQGHTVGLAARTEQLAAADRVCLTEHTAKLVTGYMRLRDLGVTTLKGVREHLRIYELEGTGELRTRLEVSRARGFSRLVGRADEMAALELALKQALDGRGQVIGVVGEPGVGKSRLCFEFTERCRARALRVYEAHCPAHGKTLPFFPMLQLLRSYLGITDSDTDDDARKKIAGTLVLVDPSFQEALPLIFDAVGVPDPQRPAPRIDPEARQRQLFAFVRRLLQQRPRGNAAVLLLDDAHWIDAVSDAFLAQLADTVPGTHCLLVLNFRPDYRAPWMGKSSYQQLPLCPLGPDAAAQLLSELLGSDPSVSALAERIGARTGGNPFFIEEVVQSLAEAGRLTGARGAYRLAAAADELGEIGIPATVNAVLAARIDRLAEREKTVLQAAAVIGKEFTEPVLQRVMEADGVVPVTGAELGGVLEALSNAEFFCPLALYPVAEYAFKHPLTQEVAYHSQLGDRRRHIHAAVAGAIEAQHPTKLDERAALLAYHWEAADESLTAARWHRRAAEWTGGRDRAEMLRHWQRVRALLARVPESPETLALGVLARAQSITCGVFLGRTEDAAALFAEASGLAERLGHPEARVRLLGSYAFATYWSGEAEASLAHVREAVRLADQSGNVVLRVVARGLLPLVLVIHGELHEALAVTDEVEVLCGGDADIGTELFGFGAYGMTLAHRSLALAALGRLADAEQVLERVAALAQIRREPELLITAHVYSELRCQLAGDAVRALQHAQRSVELAEAATSTATGVASAIALGRALLLNERWSDAAATLEQVLAVMRERHGGLHMEPTVLASLAQSLAALGDVGRARALADEAVSKARRRRNFLQAQALLLRAGVLRVSEGEKAAAAIDADLRQAAAMVEENHARAYAPLIHVERAELARLVGDAAGYARELREAHRLFVEISATGHAGNVSARLSALGDSPEGRAR